MAIYGDDEILYPIDDKNQEVYIPISSLKNQNFMDQSDDDEEFLQKYTLNRKEKVKKDLICYYCTICGRNIIVINARLEKLPTRLTDSS
jgi:hypothetical protein